MSLKRGALENWFKQIKFLNYAEAFFLISISCGYGMVASAIWESFSEFLIF